VAKSKLTIKHHEAMCAADDNGHEQALACLTIELRAEPSELEIEAAARVICEGKTCPWRYEARKAKAILEAAKAARLRELQDSNKEGGT
jgi:hypothetical protein